jgi:hypothetical protein
VLSLGILFIRINIGGGMIVGGGGDRDGRASFLS